MKQLFSIQTLLISVIIGIVAYYATSVLIYILIAGVLTFLAQPFRRVYRKLFEKKKPRPALVAALSMISLLVIFIILLSIFIPLIITEARIISNIDTSVVLEHLQTPINYVQKLMQNSNFDPEKYAKEKIISILNYSNISNFFASISGIIGDFFVALFSIGFITFFFLKDQYIIISNIEKLVPKDKTDVFRKVFGESRNLLKRYIIGVSIEVILIISIVSLGCYVLGVKNAVMIGFFAGIFNVIPYVGPLIGLLFGLVIGLTTELNEVYFNDALPTLLKIGIVIIVAQVLDNVVFQPVIYSASVKAHPLEIFLIILIAGNIFGIAGMIFAVPGYTVLRLLMIEYWKILEKQH
jgi:predicted PurR-regulated permease PerM